MLTILPAIQDPAVFTQVRRHKGDTSVCTIGLPTNLHTLAEIIMAGVDLRAARLRPMASKYDDPEGMACLPEPPESGRDANGKQFSHDWRTHIMETFGADLERFSGAFREYLKEKFLPSHLRSPGTGISERELLNAIAAQLREEAEAKDARLTYYYIVKMPEKPEARKKSKPSLQISRQTFPLSPSCVCHPLSTSRRMTAQRPMYGSIQT